MQGRGNLSKRLTQLWDGERSKVTQVVPEHPPSATVEFILMSYRWSLIKLLAKRRVLIGLFVFLTASPTYTSQLPASGLLFHTASSLGNASYLLSAFFSSVPMHPISFHSPFLTPSTVVGFNTNSWRNKPLPWAPCWPLLALSNTTLSGVPREVGWRSPVCLTHHSL